MGPIVEWHGRGTCPGRCGVPCRARGEGGRTPGADGAFAGAAAYASPPRTEMSLSAGKQYCPLHRAFSVSRRRPSLPPQLRSLALLVPPIRGLCLRPELLLPCPVRTVWRHKNVFNSCQRLSVQKRFARGLFSSLLLQRVRFSGGRTSDQIPCANQHAFPHSTH